MFSNPFLLAAGRDPFVELPQLEGGKLFVYYWSPPEFSLPFIVLLFIVLLLTYKKWTKPVIALTLLVVFVVVYFGAMLVDYNYYEILKKADNVPITIMLLGCGIFLWTAFRQAARNDVRLEAGKPLVDEERDDKVLVWPDLVYTELICLVLASAVLVIWAVVLPAPLESPANPAGPPNPSKAPWYFLGLQEMLVYFDPWMAGVILPVMIITGLIAMPYFDTNPKGNGYYTFRERPFAISVWLFGFLILWVVLIVFGVFLRGPNWNFFGPFAYWDANMQVPLTNVMMSDYFWNPKDLLGFGWSYALPKNPFIREISGIVFTAAWVFILPPLLARTVMRKMCMQLGTFRFYVMAFHLVIMAMLPLKMALRWLLTLKYFIYLPEYNLNL